MNADFPIFCLGAMVGHGISGGMFPRRIGVPIVLLSLLVLPCLMLGMLKAMAGHWGGKQPFRTWTDNSGKFSAKARLITDQGNAVMLERSDGRLVTVPVQRLSSEDRNYLLGDSAEGKLFRLSFWKWHYSDPQDLWAILVKITPMWVSLAFPLVVTGFGLLLQKRMNA